MTDLPDIDRDEQILWLREHFADELLDRVLDDERWLDANGYSAQEVLERQESIAEAIRDHERGL